MGYARRSVKYIIPGILTVPARDGPPRHRKARARSPKEKATAFEQSIAGHDSVRNIPIPVRILTKIILLRWMSTIEFDGSLDRFGRPARSFCWKTASAHPRFGNPVCVEPTMFAARAVAVDLEKVGRENEIVDIRRFISRVALEPPDPGDRCRCSPDRRRRRNLRASAPSAAILLSRDSGSGPLSVDPGGGFGVG